MNLITAKVKYPADKLWDSKRGDGQYATVKIEVGNTESRVYVYPEGNAEKVRTYNYARSLTPGQTIQVVGQPGRNGQMQYSLIVPDEFDAGNYEGAGSGQTGEAIQPQQAPNVNPEPRYVPVDYEPIENHLRMPRKSELAAVAMYANNHLAVYKILFQSAYNMLSELGVDPENLDEFAKDIATHMSIKLERSLDNVMRTPVITHSPEFKKLMAELGRKYPDKKEFDEKRSAMAHFVSNGDASSARQLTIKEVRYALSKL